MANNLKNKNAAATQLQSDSSNRININPARLLGLVMSRWHWVAISFVLGLAIAFLYAKSVPYAYLSESLIQYDAKSKEAKFSATELVTGGKESGSDKAAEVYRIKSTYVVKRTLDSLNTHFFFFRKEGLRNTNIYPQRAFNSEILDYNIDLYKGGMFVLNKKGASYDLQYVNEAIAIDTTFKNVKAGMLVKVPGLYFTITSDVVGDFDKVSFSFIDYWQWNQLSERMAISEVERGVPVMRATFSWNNPTFTRDFLNTVVVTYRNFDLETKRASSAESLKFIDQQLATFEGLMRQSSSDLASIKRSYNLVDVSATSTQYMSRVSALEERKLQLKIQGDNFDMVTENIKNNKEVVANVVGWDNQPDPFLNSMLESLNLKMAQRKQSLINFSEQSVLIKNLDEDIAILKHKIVENVNLQKRKAEQAYRAYDQQLNALNKDLNKMPTAERDLLYTTSDVDVNKNIYTLLLNKKLETSIDMAGQTPSFSAIEAARISKLTGPFETLIAVIGAIVGLLLGVVLIFLVRAFNSRFVDVNDIVRTPEVSLTGIVKSIKKVDDSRMLNLQHTEAALAESMNSIRTNVLYQLSNNTHKIVAITSAAAGEGKSFLSVNLAVSLAKLGKSVVLVATDLRRSRLHAYFNDENKTGLSNYLEKGSSELNSIIRTSSAPGLHYITAGKSVTNPSELLHREFFAETLEELKGRFDYVILDTAPVGLVSDSVQAMRSADVNLFVLRWRYSPKTAVSLPYTLVDEYGLSKISVVVNDFRDDALYSSLGDDDDTYKALYTNYGDYYGSEDAGIRRGWKLLKRK